MEKQFLAMLKDLTDNKFYVPTNEHSSGFNECELTQLADEDSAPTYLINEEGLEKELTFSELMEQYPKFTLCKRYAFEGDFETWSRFKKALDEEIEINIVEI